MTTILRTALIVAGLVLASCATPDPEPRPAAPTFQFTHGAPLALRVSEVIVTETYAPPLKAPYKEHEFAATPATIVRQWAREKTAVAGGAAPLRLIVEEASVREESIDGGKAFLKPFRPGKDRRLLARVIVRADYDDGRMASSVRVETSGSVDIDRQASVNEAEAQYYALLELMAGKIDDAMSRRLADELAPLVAR